MARRYEREGRGRISYSRAVLVLGELGCLDKVLIPIQHTHYIKGYTAILANLLLIAMQAIDRHHQGTLTQDQLLHLYQASTLKHPTYR